MHPSRPRVAGGGFRISFRSRGAKHQQNLEQVGRVVASPRKGQHRCPIAAETARIPGAAQVAGTGRMTKNFAEL
jgi:hypothetical protein